MIAFVIIWGDVSEDIKSDGKDEAITETHFTEVFHCNLNLRQIWFYCNSSWILYYRNSLDIPRQHSSVLISLLEIGYNQNEIPIELELLRKNH